MNDEDAKKIQRRAKYLAVRWGHADQAEDFAQEVIISHMRWPGQTVEQALINFLRKEHGDPRTGSGRMRKAGTVYAQRLDAPISAEEGRDGQLRHDIVGDSTPDPRTLEPARDFAYLFRGKKAQIYALRFDEELSLKEIGRIMGLTEAAISLSLIAMQKRIVLEAGLEGVRERLADDPGITEIEIDWIRL